ncbi:hypothetical protein J7382_17330 [Shimia sp. R11_0]|uniref:hypothetical protein n=1 Tax=Shimia sp. R11_0 TaxID=2821096 RepID=UPI001ADCBCA6|nr:hypothetical protein [Shimia sp. R11_0]MBO9479311.1 hypothetical protein [Shimia sp. R11_0]
MTQKFSPDGARALDPELRMLRGLLAKISEELLQLYDGLRSGDGVSGPITQRKLGEMRHCLRLVFLMETDFEERRAKQQGAARTAPLDLTVARSEIGRKLDRLRTSVSAAGVSGQSE